MIGDHDDGPFFTRVGVLPLIHRTQDVPEIVVYVPNGRCVLRRRAATHVAVLVDTDEVGKEEVRGRPTDSLDRIDGCGANHITGGQPVGVTRDLRHEDVVVDGNRSGTGDRVDDVP